MIDTNVVNQRIGQLQQEREQVNAGLRELDAERERARHLVSAYDGAIGELQRLAALADMGADMAQQE